MKYFLIVFFSFLLSLFSTNLFAYTITEKIGDNEFCKIVKVDDGDTFTLDCLSKIYPNVRLLGVNAPDKNQKTGKNSCFYNEAKKYIENRMDRLYKVEFYGSDICKDPYKGCRNLVRLIDLDGDFDLGERMIEKGFAFSWTNFSVIPASIHNIYDQKEAFAYEKKLWLWGKCEVDFYDDSHINSSRPDKMTSSVQN